MIKRITVLGATVAAGCLLAVPAHAGCGVSQAVLNSVQSNAGGQSMQGTGPSGSMSTMLQGMQGQGTQSNAPLAGQNQAIVGMWHFTFTSEGNTAMGIPDGAILDDGFQTWHSDGTEITNSLRPPPSSNFCMGVWGSHGTYGYGLNHYALSWDPTGTVFIGPANIREHVQVSTDGGTISGTFTIDQYASDGVTLLAHIEGAVDGTRISP